MDQNTKPRKDIDYQNVSPATENLNLQAEQKICCPFMNNCPAMYQMMQGNQVQVPLDKTNINEEQVPLDETNIEDQNEMRILRPWSHYYGGYGHYGYNYYPYYYYDYPYYNYPYSPRPMPWWY